MADLVCGAATGSEVLDAVNLNTTTTESNTTDIGTNATNIATNVSNIATNTGNIGTLQTPNSLALVPQSSAPAYAEGLIFYDNSAKALSVYSDIPGVTLNIGQESYIRVINKTGATIPNGTIVRQTGVDLATQLPLIASALADSFAYSTILGLTTHEVANNTQGFATTFGTVSDLDTTGFIAGEAIFLSETLAGQFTSTPPDIASKLGHVIIVDGSIGRIFVSPVSNKALPTVLAYLKDGIIDVKTISTNYQDVVDYASFGNVVMNFDPVTGIITIPSTGIYTLSINLIVLFDSVGNDEETFNLRVVGSVSGTQDIPVVAGRNGGYASAYPQISFSAIAGEEVKLQLGGASANLTNVVESLLGFEIESKHIR